MGCGDPNGLGRSYGLLPPPAKTPEHDRPPRRAHNVDRWPCGCSCDNNCREPSRKAGRLGQGWSMKNGARACFCQAWGTSPGGGGGATLTKFERRVIAVLSRFPCASRRACKDATSFSQGLESAPGARKTSRKCRTPPPPQNLRGVAEGSAVPRSTELRALSQCEPCESLLRLAIFLIQSRQSLGRRRGCSCSPREASSESRSWAYPAEIARTAIAPILDALRTIPWQPQRETCHN